MTTITPEERAEIKADLTEHHLFPFALLGLRLLEALEASEKDGFILSAGQCIYPDGDGLIGNDSGYPECKKVAEIEILKARVAALERQRDRLVDKLADVAAECPNGEILYCSKSMKTKTIEDSSKLCLQCWHEWAAQEGEANA